MLARGLHLLHANRMLFTRPSAIIIRMQKDRAQNQYLALGHVACDVHPDGFTLGGTVAYAGRTAFAMGRDVGVVTACRQDFDLTALQGLSVNCSPSEQTTTFENRYGVSGRTQILQARATSLRVQSIPHAWLGASLVHFAPIINELDLECLQAFPDALRCLTPQGWLRTWQEQGRIALQNWQSLQPFLVHADVAVLSIEDVQGDEDAVQALGARCPVLAITRGPAGASIFAHGERRELPAPQVVSVDPTGAGDIFAAAFFIHFQETGNAWEAGQFANRIAAASVTRKGLASTPSPLEIETHRLR